MRAVTTSLFAIRVAALALGLLSAGAMATPQSAMTFRTFEPCRGSGSFCGTRILASGVIEGNTHQKLASFIANAPKSAIPPVTTIVFDSPGGSVAGGMALGRYIRSRGYDTALELNVEEEITPSSDNGAVSRNVATNTMCASACAIAFLGGLNRSFSPDTRYGVHQFYSATGSLGDSTTQVAMTVIALYVEEMGVNRRLLDFATSAGPNSMRWLSEREGRELQVDNTRPMLTAWSITADSNGVPILTVRQTVGQTRELALALRNVKGGLALAVLVLVAKDGHSRFPLGYPLQARFTSNWKEVAKPAPVEPWRVAQKNLDGSVVYIANVGLTHEDLSRIASASALRFHDDFPNAISDLSITTELSPEGLRNGANLLLRTR